MKSTLSLLVVVTVSWVTLSNCTWAYDAYKEPILQRYHLKTVSCKACHANSKDRTIYNKFGQLFVDALKGQEIAKKYEEAKAKGDEQKKKYEAEMAKTFTAVLAVVEKKTMTIEDMIKAGLLNGTRLRDKK